jgi:uncharacterized protein YndB with AHSA1/START domain
MSADRTKGELELTREFAAPPERVFRALTNPEDLARWWTGVGGISKAHYDLRPGGLYRFEFAMGGGKIAVVHGVIREVDPPRRLVMTWFSPEFPDQETLLSFELEPRSGGGSRMKLRHTGLLEPGSCEAHEQGWIEALTLLLAWLAAAGPIFSAGARGAKGT